MGSRSSVLENELDSATTNLIPEPSIFRDENFVFIHYSTEPIVYKSMQDVLKNVPAVLTSDLSEYECQDERKVLVISGLDPEHHMLTAGMIVETIGKSIVIQMGSAEVICALMKNEKPLLLYIETLSEDNCNYSFKNSARNLYKLVKTKPKDLAGAIQGLFSITKTDKTPYI